MARSNTPRPVGTVRTQRNRKVSCDADTGCGLAVYMSRSAIERAGVWPCPACGDGRMLPVDPDDAALVLDPVELEEHPAVIEHRQAWQSAAHGQAGVARRAKRLRPLDVIAAERVEKARRVRAREQQLGALRRGDFDPARSGRSGADSLARHDEIPF